MKNEKEEMRINGRALYLLDCGRQGVLDWMLRVLERCPLEEGEDYDVVTSPDGDVDVVFTLGAALLVTNQMPPDKKELALMLIAAEEVMERRRWRIRGGGSLMKLATQLIT